MSRAFTFIDVIRNTLIHAAPDMPPDFWWVTGFVIGILALTAVIDIFTAKVPDALIFIGLFTVSATLGMAASWDTAALHLRQAIEVGVVIWAINAAWRVKFKHDALGMGDAKWTMLAVACFGMMPAATAWGMGAILAVTYIGSARAFRNKVAHVTFAPFLFLGLVVGLYWVRFGG